MARTAFDLEAHRGGRGLRPENTLASFGHALALGVTTLELDTGVTKDGVVGGQPRTPASSLECRDTEPAFPGDPQFPYVGSTDKASDGQLIKDLTSLEAVVRDPTVQSSWTGGRDWWASQDLGLRVVPYTVNDPATIQRVIDLGVDGIIADDVPALVLVAKRNGLR